MNDGSKQIDSFVWISCICFAKTSLWKSDNHTSVQRMSSGARTLNTLTFEFGRKLASQIDSGHFKLFCHPHQMCAVFSLI